MNILILDSDKKQLARTANALRENGITEILISSDKSTANQILSEHAIDLVVSEIKIDSWSIDELLEHAVIKNKIPVLALSKEISETETLRLLDSGVVEIISKKRLPLLAHSAKRAVNEALLKNSFQEQIPADQKITLSNYLNDKMSSFLEQISSSTKTEFGQNYFSKLTETIYKFDSAKAVLIGKYVKDQKSIRTISYRIDGIEQESMLYSLLNTPCENVIQTGVCIYPDKVQNSFPKDNDLIKLKAASYIGTAIMNRSHEPIGLVVVIHDKPMVDMHEKKMLFQLVAEITASEMQRLSSDELLVQSEKKYREVVENQSELIVRWKPDGKIVFSNKSYQQFHQLSESELIKKSVYDLVKDRARFEQKVKQLSIENDRVSDIHLTTNSAGEKKWHEWSDHAFFDSSGKLIEIQSIGRDITIRVEAEMEIKAKEEFSQSIFSAIRDHIAVIDKNGKILSTNKSWKQFAVENNSSLQMTDIGTNYYDVCERAIQLGDETAKRALSGIKSVVAGDQFAFELEYPCHSETARRWFVMRVAPMNSEQGGAVITHTDISEKKNKELELMVSYEEIMNTQQVNQALINGDSILTLSEHILQGLDEIANVQRSRIYLYDKQDHKLILHAEKTLEDFKKAVQEKTGVDMGMAIPKLQPGGFYNEVITEQNIILTHDVDQIKMLIAEHAATEEQKKHVDWAYDLVGIKTFGLYPLKRGSEVIGLLSITTPYTLNYKEKSTVFRFAQRASLVISRKMEQDELVQSEEKFKAISNYTSNWETWVDEQGQPIWINPAVFNHSGYTPEELLSMPDFYREIIYKEDYEKIIETVTDAIVNRTDGENLEVRCIHKNGSIKWFTISWKQVYDPSGKWLGIRSSGSDITALKEQKNELIQYAQELKEIQKIAKLGEWIWHIQSDIIQLSDHLCEMIGLDLDQSKLPKEKLFYLTHPESHKALEEALLKAKNNAETGDVEIRLNSLSGEDKYLLIRARNQIQTEIQNGSVRGSALDITELKNSFIKSKENEQKFQKIFESIQDVYFQVNSAGVITLLSPSVKDLTGYEPEELIGKPMTSLFSSLEPEKFPLEVIDPTEKSEQFEATLISKKNEEIIVSINLSRYINEQDSLFVMQGMMRNITERKRHEKSLENQRKRLLEIVKLNTQIIETSDHFYYVLNVSDLEKGAVPLKYVSIQVAEILGMSELELLNQDNRWTSLIHPEDKEKLETAISNIIVDKKPTRVSYRVIHRITNQLIWVDDYACPLLNDQNEVIEIFGSVKDVSERVNSILKITDEKKQSIAYQYQLLSSQLNPHFIYNTLNSFQFYILEGNVEASLNHISDFSTLMRSVLENSMHKYITLDEEINFLQKYIRISEQRMTGKLKFNIEVLKDVETSELLIPPMLLQPYLENAIIHAFIESPRKPELSVQFKKKGNRIECAIQDNGIGRASSHVLKKKMSGLKTKSYGLGILKERIDLLNQLSGYDFKLQIQDLHDADQSPIGTKVLISFDCIYNKLV